MRSLAAHTRLPALQTVLLGKILGPKSESRLLLESAVLGVVGALGAQLFTWLLRVCSRFFLQTLAGYTPPTESNPLVQHIGPHGLWLIPLVTAFGGLVSGFLVYRFAPEAEGHGTDTAVNAFHRKQGLIRSRVPPIKLVASAITIGSGGSAGREGPIALIAAGLGSLYGRLTDRPEEHRRLLLLAGMAAGLSAIFRSPLGTAVFATEVLYWQMEFEVGALLYTLIAALVAYSVNGAFVGFRPLFQVPPTSVPRLGDFGAYIGLGVAAGILGTLLPQLFYSVRDFFRALKVPVWTKPAIGGLGVGLIALKLPQVLGGGYGWIQLAIDGHLALRLLALLMVMKVVAFSLTVASGGSGGVFAPSLYAGAMLGGALALVMHQPPAVFVVVGMAAVFGAAARVPIATILMVTEMTGGFQLLAPAGLAVLVSFLLQTGLSNFCRYRSLYENQVPRPEDSPAHYLENIQLALRLLGRRDLRVTDSLGHLDLLRLLRSRIRFDLPGDKQLTMWVVEGNSPVVGKTIGTLYRQLQQYEFEIVVVMRREHLLLPHANTLLDPEDRVILIAAPATRERLAKYLTPIAEVQGKGLQQPEENKAE